MSSRLAVLPVTADLTSVRGNAFSITITMQWENTQDLVMFDMWSFDAKLLVGASDVAYTVSVIERGIITVSLTGVQTNAIAAGTYEWWLAASFPTGSKRTLIRGEHTFS